MTTYDGKKKVVLFETLQIIEGIPSPKYVNTDTSAVFFFRRAKRQWKRGLCSSTVGWVPANLDLYPDKAETILTQSKIPWSGRNRMVTWFQSPIRSNINFAWAQRLLETNPLPSYEEAFQRLQNLKAAAVAFDDRYALVLNWHSPNFRLCRDGIKIAEVHKDNPYLVLNHAPLFHQEIKDLYRRMGKEAKVE